MSKKNIGFFQLDKIADVVKELSNGRLLWNEIENQYPKFEQQEASAK